MKFKYTARDVRGGRRQGNIDAMDLRSAASSLREMELVPVSINADTGLDLNNLNFGLGRVSSNDITNFTRQLATMITAGLPLTDALSLLKIQSPPSLVPIVTEILTDVQAGVSLSEAMAKHPKAFAKVYVALVKAGEAAGVVETVLNRLAENLERSRDFTGKVKGAMIYPIIVLIGMVAVMILMMVAVIPKLTSFYTDSNAKLPWPTLIVIGISNFFVNYWILVVLLAIAAVFGGIKGLQIPAGRRWWDELIYKLPIVGPLAKQIMLTELTRTLALLIGAGVSVVDSLNIVAESTGNVVVESQIKVITRQVEKGFPVSISFADSGVFPPIVGQMLAVGEETGKMDDVLNKLSVYFGTDAEEKVKGLTSAIEPLIIILLALGVGFLMFAIIMPLYGVTNQI